MKSDSYNLLIMSCHFMCYYYFEFLFLLKTAASLTYSHSLSGIDRTLLLELGLFLLFLDWRLLAMNLNASPALEPLLTEQNRSGLFARPLHCVDLLEELETGLNALFLATEDTVITLQRSVSMSTLLVETGTETNGAIGAEVFGQCLFVDERPALLGVRRLREERFALR